MSLTIFTVTFVFSIEECRPQTVLIQCYNYQRFGNILVYCKATATGSARRKAKQAPLNCFNLYSQYWQTGVATGKVPLRASRAHWWQRCVQTGDARKKHTSVATAPAANPDTSQPKGKISGKLRRQRPTQAVMRATRLPE
jgi:hypothetical protein